MLALFLWLSWASTALAVVATNPIDSQIQHTLHDEGSVTWPSLQFHFKVKRSSMDIFGQTEFSVFASPNVSADEASILYDVFATFHQGSTEYSYTLVDGVAHLQTRAGSGASSVHCLHSELNDFPPINAIISAINEATPVSRLSLSCGGGDLFQVSVRSQHFTVCASSNSSLQLYGRDTDIIVEYLDDHVDIQAPTMDSDQECEAEVGPSSVTSTGRSLLRGEQLESRKLEAELDFWLFNDDDSSDADEDEDEASCSCKSTPRPCIFIHGLGVKDENAALEDSLPYWGEDIASHAPCCTSIKYAHLNTVNNTWLNATQQQQVCDRALIVSNSSTKTIIRDTIVVSHSMGSLMLAAAMANGRCELDSSSTWVSTAAPMIGSMASDYAQKVCAGETNVVAEEVAEYKKQCPVNVATKSLAYEGGDYSTGRLNAAYTAAQEAYRTNVSAVMCSESFSGILSSYQASFWILGEMIPHKSTENDGTVEFQSCAKGLPEEKFGDSYTNRFYRTKLNHYDMQFRAGDAFWNEAKMPLKWFECLL